MANAGEDGDFVQLRAVRERRLKEQTTIHGSGNKRPLLSLAKAALLGPKLKNEISEKLLTHALAEQLFTAVDADNVNEVSSLVSQIRKSDEIWNIRKPDTGENVLHYAISHGKRNIAEHLILTGSHALLLSHHDVERSGSHGKNNSLHIATENNDIGLAKQLLNKLRNSEMKLELIKLETAVEIQGQRPRLLSCLHLAAYHGHSRLVQLYLDCGIDVNHVNGKKDTPLLWASRWGHNETVNLLLDRGADPDVENDKGSTALYWAVRYEHPETVSILLNKGQANPNKTRKLGLVAPLIVASAFGNTEIVSLLVFHPQIDINMRIRGGETAVHHAAQEGHLSVLRLLIQKGAKNDEPDEIGDTPLLHAAKNGHADVVIELIRNGANVKHRNHEGHDVWDFAIDNKENELLVLLVSNMNEVDSSRQPLCIAASNGKCDKIQFLLDTGMEAINCSSDGSTFVHHAAMTDKYEVIETFHSNISVNLQNKEGNTPLHIACLKGFSKTIDSLLKCKARADIINKKGETPLHVAAYSKHITVDSVKTLIQYTIKTHAWESLNAKDYHGNNCLHIAGKNANPHVLWEFRFVRFKDREADGLTPLHNAVRPGEPEILDTMLNIFETMNRDARINEQSYGTSETVLHLAADAGHARCVKRLIEFGADISVTDHNGDSVLHRLTRACALEPHNIEQHLNVFEIILNNIVKWWCMRTNISIPEEKNSKEFMEIRREATLFVTHRVSNQKGLSVIDLAFKLCSSEIVSRILIRPEVTLFTDITSDSHSFDISGVTPLTTGAINSGCCERRRRVGPHIDKDEALGVNFNGQLSGIEWLISQSDKAKAAEILDLPPIQMIERYYMSMVAQTFIVLTLLHIAYMSIFTYVGVDLLGSLRVNESRINFSDPATILLCAIVPLEPACIVLYVIYTVTTHLISNDIGRRSVLSRKRGPAMVLSVLWSYMLTVVCVLFAALVFTWIGLFVERYEYQDYFLAAAICIGWLLTISFTRGIRLIHYFYRMLLSMIVRDVLRFLLVYVFIIMAFGFAFHVMFQASEDVVTSYATPGDTLFLTFNMMIGMGELFDGTLEENFQSIGRDNSVTYLKFLYLVYIILGTVILLNVLIAMMNDSYSMILRENSVTWRIESVSLGVDIESSFPASRRISNIDIVHGSLGPSKNDVVEGWWYVNMPASEFKIYNQKLVSKQTTNPEDALSKRMDELESRTKLMEGQITQTLAEIKEILQKPKHTSKKKKKKRTRSENEGENVE